MSDSNKNRPNKVKSNNLSINIGSEEVILTFEQGTGSTDESNRYLDNLVINPKHGMIRLNYKQNCIEWYDAYDESDQPGYETVDNLDKLIDIESV